ncbi:YrdB family protein [Paenibacillus filicis]|uniref:YrdB family protein n=1 Tax=Paenibacillus gyeongsangnamensis TaxID=3388067 RepID=A0ABT4QLH0_9BACL|nr:YrdB family protein [Paenibacillus filicis]MCZ8517685.1 YrdB family protein [Paenibacillus filicis]
MVMLLKWVNLVLRGLMELGIVVALAYWGYRTGKSTFQSTLLSIGAPLLVFSVWTFIDFRKVAPMPELFRLIQELILSVLAAVAWYVAGQRTLGVSLALVSIVHHVLVYLLGERLLK